MSFFLSALPSLFSSPLVRDTIGSIAGNIWNSIKGNAALAANDFVNNTTQSAVKAVNDNFVRPLTGKRVNPFDDGTDEADWANGDPDPDPAPQRFQQRPNPRGRQLRRKRVRS